MAYSDMYTALLHARKVDDPNSNLLRPSPVWMPQAGVRVLESVELDFSRYGDTLFEVLFAGGRLAGGGNVVEEGKKLDINVRVSMLHPSQVQRCGIELCRSTLCSRWTREPGLMP